MAGPLARAIREEIREKVKGALPVKDKKEPPQVRRMEMTILLYPMVIREKIREKVKGVIPVKAKKKPPQMRKMVMTILLYPMAIQVEMVPS